VFFYCDDAMVYGAYPVDEFFTHTIYICELIKFIKNHTYSFDSTLSIYKISTCIKIKHFLLLISCEKV
jgi:hypothetical protein